VATDLMMARDIAKAVRCLFFTLLIKDV